MAFDLFCELNATPEQLDFPIVYASGKEGWAKMNLDDESKDITPLLETIMHRVLPPVADVDAPFQMLVTMLAYDPYVGHVAIGRVATGRIKVGDPIMLVKRADGTVERGKVTKILKHKGLPKVEVQEALAGDIVHIAGAGDVRVADTLTSPDKPEALPAIHIDEPTISMFFSHNTSPLAGKDGGKFLTSRHIRERLEHEAKVNVGIKVEPVQNEDRFKVSGRGELHLAILIEMMRREGYELEVSRPQVIFKDVDGVKMEPIEELVIEVDPEFQGTVIERLGSRKADLKVMINSSVGTVRLEYLIPSRALIGLRSELLQLTRGTAVLNQIFHDYEPFRGEIENRQVAVLISQNNSKAVAYGLWGLQERGEIFVHVGDDLYTGMIVGVNNKGNDLVVNANREKKLTNMRSSGADEAIQLIPPREMTLDFALEFIADDELVEITPKNIRLRKRYLDENERKRNEKK
jgi:GTP-binding protein